MRESLGDLSTPGTVNVNDMSFNLSQPEIVELVDFWTTVQNGQPLDSGVLSDVIQIFIKGLEDPTVQADALGLLMVPECADVLDDTLAQTWSPDLDAETKDRLIEIATKPTEQERIQGLCRLLSEQEDNPIPFRNFPSSDMMDRETLVAATRTQEEISPDDKRYHVRIGYDDDPNYAAFTNINAAYKNHDDLRVRTLLQQTPQLETVLSTAGAESWALLIDLADDHDFGNMACRLLYEAGSDIVPIIDEFTPPDSRARDVAEWILTGNTPNFESRASFNNLAIQAVETSNMTTLVELIGEAEDRSHLVETVATAGDKASPMLVELLGNPDRRIQVFAMDALYLQGSEAVDDLMRARVNSDPIIRSNAEILLQAHFTGESSWENVGVDFQYSYPFTNSLFSGNDNNTTSISEFSLDVDDLTERLVDSETHFETLRSLIQIGQPTVPTLCQAIINSRRRSRERC